jgi:hypothetical protein
VWLTDCERGLRRRRHDGNAMYVLHDRALVDHGRRRLESNGPTSFIGVDIGALLQQVTSGRSSIAKWWSWLLGWEIHVSPLSDTWLRAQEADSNKHGVDV